MSSKERKEKILKKINKERSYQTSETKSGGTGGIEKKVSGIVKTVKKGSDKLKSDSKSQVLKQDRTAKRAMYSNEKALKEEKIMDKIFKEKGAYKKSRNGEPSDNPLLVILSKGKKLAKRIVNKYRGMTPDARYKMIGAWVVGLLFLFVVVGIVVSGIGDNKKNTRKDHNNKEGIQASADASSDASGEAVDTNPLTACSNEAITNLITSYIQALKTADIETLKALDMCQDTYRNETDIKNTNSVVEDYRNITIYTKNGPYAGGVTAYVVTDIKFINIDKTCQGMFQYVVRLQEDGSYKIDTTPAEELDDDDVENAMVVLSQSEDVLMLIDSVNQQCAADIEADANLKAYVEGTLSNQSGVPSSVQTTEAPAATTETPAATTEVSTTEAPAQTE